MTTRRYYPAWVCYHCGLMYGARGFAPVSTWHMGICGVCNEEKAVTEPRDCGQLKDGWQDHGD